jgi:hypothetical protein
MTAAEAIKKAQKTVRIKNKIMVAFEKAVANRDFFDEEGEVELWVLCRYYGAKKAGLEAYARFIEQNCPELQLHRDGGLSVTRRGW